MEQKVLDRINELIGREGGYSNNPNDLGGETMYGVTIAEARKAGYTGPMISMPRDFAIDFYYNKFWKAPGFDSVCVLSEEIADELFDTGVNMGTGKAAEFLQVALNALNRQGKDYPDIEEDCDIGPGTLSALAEYLKFRGDKGVDVMLKALNCLQGARYIEISRTRGKNEDFVFGWLDNRVYLPG